MQLDSTNYAIAKIKSSKEDLDTDLHRHPFYELFFFYGGSGKHTIDFEQFDLSNNCLQIVRPYQLHQVLQSEDSKGFVIKISPLLIQSNPLVFRFFNWINYNKKIKAGVIVQTEEALMLTKACQYLAQQKNQNQYALLSNLALFISVFKNNQTQQDGLENDKNSDLFTRFIQLAESNFTTQRSADFYAQKMHLSLHKINAVVKDRTGMTVKRFLIELLLIEAKRLVVYSSMSVKEIAYQLAFLEPPHFTNFFKKHSGASPSNFRRNNLNK